MQLVTLNGIEGKSITTRTGKIVGVGVGFLGAQSAADVRAAFKASGLKGKKLTKAVNDVLTGKADVAWVKYEAHLSALRSAGYVPSVMEAREKSALVRFAKPSDTNPVVTKEAALAVLGISGEELDALLAAKS